jgi:hypothetical protein
VVVTIAKLRTHSPAGEPQFSHDPARAMSPDRRPQWHKAACRSRSSCRVGNRHYWQLPL